MYVDGPHNSSNNSEKKWAGRPVMVVTLCTCCFCIFILQDHAHHPLRPSQCLQFICAAIQSDRNCSVNVAVTGRTLARVFILAAPDLPPKSSRKSITIIPVRGLSVSRSRKASDWVVFTGAQVADPAGREVAVPGGTECTHPACKILCISEATAVCRVGSVIDACVAAGTLQEARSGRPRKY